MRKEKEKEEEEEIRHVWPFYILSLNPSKQKKSSKTGNQCNQYKQPTVNGSAVTKGSFCSVFLSFKVID